VELCENGR
jgi:E3 ubiquitin-protein ligase HERC2